MNIFTAATLARTIRLRKHAVSNPPSSMHSSHRRHFFSNNAAHSMPWFDLLGAPRCRPHF